MSDESILHDYAEVGDIITHSFDGSTYNESIFLGWTNDQIHCQPIDGGKEYFVEPNSVTHLNRQLLRIVPLAEEEKLS